MNEAVGHRKDYFSNTKQVGSSKISLLFGERDYSFIYFSVPYLSVFARFRDLAQL
jgi:hypothetical protein